MPNELKPCPFCGGKARISFKDYRFYGWDCITHQKIISYRVQVICNKCKSRGKPIITKSMENPMPYITEWWSSHYSGSDIAKAESERFRPYIENAIEAWNRRVDNDEPS